jgi:hypothetical protein
MCSRFCSISWESNEKAAPDFPGVAKSYYRVETTI